MTTVLTSEGCRSSPDQTGSFPLEAIVGVYLDHRAGILSFYSVSESMTLLHRVQTRFTEPLLAGVGMVMMMVRIKNCWQIFPPDAPVEGEKVEETAWGLILHPSTPRVPFEDLLPRRTDRRRRHSQQGGDTDLLMLNKEPLTIL
ncbi:hypothetical protein CCH79_00006300 [Gambusia affinis]|uniref:B30.2/SPRY domain-containing protein n=1 Tax=Gambusia affinis TaxID=33528 RepID=A0A315W0N8_GAMAF|nr:hypothetical protein CCH79_00006300 [Gambusia affinis]